MIHAPGRLRAALAGLALITSCAPIEIRSAIEIEAPPERVWDVLADIERYPDWNPYHVAVEGELAVGQRIDVHIRRPDGKEIHIEPHVIRMDRPEELVWGGGIHGIFWGEHVFRLERLPNGHTRLEQDEDFAGFATWFADLPPDVITRGYELVNEAVKREAEAAEHTRE